MKSPQHRIRSNMNKMGNCKFGDTNKQHLVLKRTHDNTLKGVFNNQIIRIIFAPIVIDIN